MKDDAEHQLDALGDRTRREILRRLAGRPLSVQEIAQGLRVGRPAVSMHLRVLKAAGLVHDTPVGNRRIYQLDPAGMTALRDYLDWFWIRALENYVDVAEAESRMQQGTSGEIRVTKAVTVDLPIGRAFELFTDLGRWWPVQTHHLADQPGELAVVEPWVGGKWYERLADGGKCDWGTVLVWDAPNRILMTWQVGADWHYVADAQDASEVEVRFVAEAPLRTRVEFEHRHLERYGDQAERMRSILDRPTGAGQVIRAYAAAAAESADGR